MLRMESWGVIAQRTKKNASWNVINRIWGQDPRTGYISNTPISYSNILNEFIIQY